MPLDQLHELTWGALVLDSAVSPDTPWLCETMADNASLGNPVPLVEVVRSMLSDGSLAVTTGYDNRELKFRLRLSASDGQALAQAEAALMTEVLAERPAALLWTPSNVEAWTCVFDVVTARLDRDYGDGWDYDDRFRQHRYYELTLNCLPWAHDLETTTIPALPVPEEPDEPAVIVPIDTCDSTTGWSRLTWPSGAWSALSTSSTGGYVIAAGSLAGGPGQASLSLVRTGAVSMGSEPYLYADVYPTVDPDGSPADISVLFDGTDDIFEPTAALATDVPGVTRYFFEAPASFTSVRIRRVVDRPSSGGTARSLRVYELGRTDRIEISGSNGFQLSRTAVVGGSAPTQAAISFDAGPDPLIGSTALIYTGTSPAVPLRRLWEASATVTPDDTKISGATNDLSSDMVFLVPVEQLRESTFSLLARLEFTGSKTIAWSARIVDADGADIPGSDVVAAGTTLAVNDSSDAWRIHTLAQVVMPVVAIEGSTTHCVEVTLSMASGGSGVLVDEAWLFDTDNGAVTVIHEPSAFQLTTIELRSPQLDAPRPAVIGTWVGHGTQDITRLVDAFGTHELRPGLVHVFTATDLAKYASCSLTYYRRHHTHAGPALPTSSEAA